MCTCRKEDQQKSETTEYLNTVESKKAFEETTLKKKKNHRKL